MALDFRVVTVTVPNGRGARNIDALATFGSRVRIAQTALTGFKLDYSSSDHHINVIEVDSDLGEIHDNHVHLSVQCQYADQNFDDFYSGFIQVLVIADVA